jgi:hypothetical protein
MPQAVQIETQSKQQGLAGLHSQRATWCTRRELALDRREQALDQSATPVNPSWECPPHLGAHSVDAPGFLSALGGDHALRPELLPDVGMISLAVEFGVGQNQPDVRLLGSRSDDSRQIRTVVPRAASRNLRQRELLIQIRHDYPLQPVAQWQRFLPVMTPAPHEERAHRSLCQARRIDRHAGAPPSFSARAAQPAHGLADRAVDGLVVRTLQKAIQSREVGHAPEPQRLTQFAMFAQPHFGFAKGPVFVAHQAKNGQQLRLIELVLAESASETWEHRLGDLQGDASKGQESDFGHRAFCLGSKQQFQRTDYSAFSLS